MKIAILALAIVLPCCSACTSTITFRENGTADIYRAQPLDVSLDEKLGQLGERTESIDVAILEVHGLLRRVFTGSGQSRWGLMYVDSSISTTMADVMLFATRWDTRYSLAVQFVDARTGRKDLLDVQGNGNSLGGPAGSSQAAVEDAVLRLYRRVCAAIEAALQ